MKILKFLSILGAIALTIAIVLAIKERNKVTSLKETRAKAMNTMQKNISLNNSTVRQAITIDFNNSAEANDIAIEGEPKYHYENSNKQLSMSMSLDLPVGMDSFSIRVRDSLIANLLSAILPDKPRNEIDCFDGDTEDIQAMVDYYGKSAYDRLICDCEEIGAQNCELVYGISKFVDTPRFVVYISSIYTYFGGAHGSDRNIVMTFSKATGSMIDHFINADAVSRMQPLIRKELCQYFGEDEEQLMERLLIDGNIIPLPRNIYPNVSGDSLMFEYGQYEITCYADGMPSFSLAVKDFSPYLTEEGKRILE